MAASIPGFLSLFLLIFGLLFGGGQAWAQAYNWKPVVFGGGGYVTGIVIHPNVPGVMYCRTDIGTAYRWNPTNYTWTPLLDFLGVNDSSYSGVESIGLDPEDSNRLYLCCGWLSPIQIMVSTNQGATFTRITPPFHAGANNYGRGCGERMAVDPNLGSVIFYGTDSEGLFESTNYGTNWFQVTSFPATTSTNGVGIVFVQFVSTSSSAGNATPVIWAGVQQTGTNLFYSTNGGTTWSGVATAVPSSIYMPMRAAQDGLGNMYVTFCDNPGPDGVNVGDVQKINLSTLACTDVTPPTGQGGFSGVTVDKENPTTVAVSTIDRWYPHDEIYRSTDGGTTWSTTYANSTMNSSSAPWVGWNSGSSTVYPSWITDVEIDPFNSNRLYHVSGGGLFSSYNFTATQPSWEFQSAGIEENAFSYTGAFLCSPPTSAPPILLSVVGDEGGYAHYDLDVSPPAGLFNPADGTNSSIDFAQLNPGTVVRTGWGAQTPRPLL